MLGGELGAEQQRPPQGSHLGEGLSPGNEGKCNGKRCHGNDDRHTQGLEAADLAPDAEG